MTFDRIGQMSIDNARRNVRYLDQGSSLKSLNSESIGRGDAAIVIAAGPSIKRRDPISRIIDSKFAGAIIATESALLYCLRNGVVPDLVVTVDPHKERIVRWLGDPDLTRGALEKDDYYRRQDMDDSFANELRTNEEVLELVDRHAKDIRIALSTASGTPVVDRVLSAGFQVYWWNPMLDDPDEPDSLTRALWQLNRMPCVNAGGNVGSTCWMMADAVLEKRHVALTGVDFAYYADTPYRATQYYYEAIELVGEDNLDEVYIPIFNPHLEAWFYTDPAYMWYRESLLSMISDGCCQTYNCTEGGILFGEGVSFVSLSDFLAKFA